MVQTYTPTVYCILLLAWNSPCPKVGCNVVFHYGSSVALSFWQFGRGSQGSCPDCVQKWTQTPAITMPYSCLRVVGYRTRTQEFPIVLGIIILVLMSLPVVRHMADSKCPFGQARNFCRHENSVFRHEARHHKLYIRERNTIIEV
jgi:hypothetical protein